MAAISDGWRLVRGSLVWQGGSALAATTGWGAAGALSRDRRSLLHRPGLACSLPLTPMGPSSGGSLLWSILTLGMDLRFLLGLFLGYKLLRGRRSRGAAASKDAATAEELRRLQQRIDGLQQQLKAAHAATKQAERLLKESREHEKQHEFTIMTLEAEVGRLEGQVAELQAALRSAVARLEVDGPAVAAEHARLIEENQAALQQLRTLAAALEQQQAAAAAAAADEAVARHRRWADESEEQDELSAENEHLRATLGEVRAQLAGVMRENAELAERLLQVAFEPTPSHRSEGSGTTPFTSPVRAPIRGLSGDAEFQRRASAARQQMQLSSELGSAFASPAAQQAAAAAGVAPADLAPAAGNGSAGGEAEAQAPENDSLAHNYGSPAASVKGWGAASAHSVASSEAS